MQQDKRVMIIIGAGVTGITAAYYFSKKKIPYIILEKSEKVGGVWSAQHWPGIRCDTDIIKYSFSFNPYLSDISLIPGRDISHYLDATAKKFGIYQHIRFGVEVKKLEFSSADNEWTVSTNNGVYKSRFVFNANGYFADRPHRPAFKGEEVYQGKVVHLLDMDEAYPYQGKDIVLVGSGASAISAAPQLCAASKSMVLLQRSPSYIYEDDNRPGPFVRLAQQAYRLGLGWPVKLVNYFLQLKDDLIFVGFHRFPAFGKWLFHRHWREVVGEEDVQKHFTPRYNPWEQRIPVAIGMKELVRNGRLKMLTGEIEKFTETGAKLVDGSLVDAELFVLATGYDLQLFKFDMYIDGEKMNLGGVNYYRAMVIGGVPNYFHPFGAPHTSWTRRMEAVSRLVARMICYMEKKGYKSICLKRKHVDYNLKITPNYLMRNLQNIPVIYGALELPSIDNILFRFFRKGNFKFSK